MCKIRKKGGYSDTALPKSQIKIHLAFALVYASINMLQ